MKAMEMTIMEIRMRVMMRIMEPLIRIMMRRTMIRRIRTPIVSGRILSPVVKWRRDEDLRGPSS